jgi:hypothetical protein
MAFLKKITIMHIRLLSFFAFLFLTSNALAQKPIPVAATPQDAITYFFNALSALDDRKMKDHITTDFLLLEDGAVWNADSLSKHMAPFKGANFSRKNSFRYIRTEQKGGDAILVYHNRADVTFNGNPMVMEWTESAHLVRQGKGWRIKMMHSTPIKPIGK